MRKMYLLLFLMISTGYTLLAGNRTDENKIHKHRLFASDVIQPADLTVCNGATTSTIVFTSNFPGTTFSWTNSNSAIGLAANGTGNIAPFIAINTGTAVVVATITVTPSDGVTNGTPRTFTITVNPTPTVNSLSNQNVCRNTTTGAINFTGTVPGTNYSWTNSNTAIGLAAGGTGNIPSFTATNNSSAPISGTVTVTPTFGSAVPEILYYKFDGAGSTAPNLASNPPAGTANGTFNGTMSQGGSGVCGGALQNTGAPSSSKYFNTGWAPNLTNSSWTLSFIASGFTSASNNSFVLGCGFDYSPDYMLVTYNSSSNAGFILRGSSTNFLLTTPAAVGPSSKTVTFVYDNSTQQVRAYVDGVLANTLNIGVPVNIIAPEFYIGNVADITGPNSGSIAAGASLDEVRFYSRALTAAEVLSLVNSCTGGSICSGTPETFDITVYPELTVNDPADQTICDGSTTTAVNFTGSGGAVYNWTNNNPSIGLAASGTGNIPSFTPTFSGTSPVTATITVTPSFSGGPACTASSQTFTITVNPVPDVNNVTSQTVCNNAATSAINFSGSVPGTSFNWTNNNTSIGLAAIGSGNIPSFTATNTTGAPVTSTITVTPEYGGANSNPLTIPLAGQATLFTGNSRGYWFTAPVSFTMTSLFVPTDASAGNQNVAVIKFNGNNAPPVFPSTTNAFSTLFVSQVNSGGVAIPVNINIAAGEVIGILGDRDGTNSYANAPYNTIIGGFNVPLTRMGMQFPLSSNLPQQIWQESGNYFSRVFFDYVILTGSCTGNPVTFDITVLPSPTVDPVNSQSVCTNSTTAPINFNGNIAGATYNWTNSNPAIGLAASGTGNIPSFTAINPGSTTAVATITVTPVSPTQPSCPGTPESFTISVSPVPTGTASPASQTVCSESAISTITFTGNVPGITFDWTRDNLAAVTGIPGVGNGDISGTLTNTTNAPVTVTFTVTPSLGGCVGTPFTVTVTVNESLPIATVSPASQTICSGNITDIVPAANYPGATFSWTRDNTSSVTGIAASGTGTISGTLFNTTTSPVTVTFTIVPTINGCDGAAVTATVVVNAVPTIICPANITINNTTGICGAAASYNTNITGAPAPTISYSFSGASSGSGSGNGSGSVFNVGVTTITVTATNICGIASCSFTVTVNDTENPTISCPGSIQANTDPGICAASVVTPNPTIADNCAATVLTWTLSGATTGASASNGINFVGTRLFNKGVTTVTYTVNDAAGNTVNCSYTVTVRDLENPVVICPSSITATTPVGSCTAIVNYTVNATDNCPGVTTQLISGPASGSAFPIGITTVSWRATDAAGNLSPICSFTVTVLDGQLPVISAQPATQTVCSGSNVTYSVTASNVVTYQWQQWNGSAWVNISGANASTFTVNNVTVANNTATYRVVLNGLCSIVNSAAASLFVNPLPAVSIRFSPLSQLLPSQSTTIESNVSPAGGSYVWRRNNTVVAGALNEVLDGLTVDQLGTYQLTYTDLNGCVSTSGSLVLTALESPRIWVYPSPNNGRFQVRYYNNFGEPVTVRVFNSAGQLVYSRELVTTDAYSRIDVDLGNQSQGVYIVKVYDTKSRELAARKIVVYR